MKRFLLLLVTFMVRISYNFSSVLYYTFPEYALLTTLPYNTIFLESDVFYKPGTNEPIPQISWDTLRDDIVLQTYPSIFLGNHFFNQQPPFLQRNIFRRIYGYPECECDQEACSCCADIKFRLMKSSETGCVRVSVNNATTLNTALLFKNEVVAERLLSAGESRRRALCFPIPRFRIVSGCARLTDVKLEGFNLNGCVTLELRITGTQIAFWQLKFVCFRIGSSGFTYSRPPSSTTQSSG